MMFAALVDIIVGLWWVAITSTTAAVLSIRAAWLGVIPKFAGMFGASALGCLATSYWLDIFDLVPGAVASDMRRGAAAVLWPAVAFVLWKLIADWRRVLK